jgi:uncharacterized protein (DUF1697 family)
MPRYIAFLRAVNVGGRVVKMTQLKQIFESAGFTKVETFIASGNVIFSTRAAAVPPMVRKIETALRKELGYEVPVLVRTDAEVAALAARKYVVFSEAEVAAAHSLSVGMLHEPLSKAAAGALVSFSTDVEQFRTHDREIYMLMLRPTLESSFSLRKLEKALQADTTFRNVNTIERLAKKYPPTPTPRG